MGDEVLYARAGYERLAATFTVHFLFARGSVPARFERQCQLSMTRLLTVFWMPCGWKKACPTTPVMPIAVIWHCSMAGYARRGIELPHAGRELILDHLAWRLDQHYKPRSTARFLSGARGFLSLLAA